MKLLAITAIGLSLFGCTSKKENTSKVLGEEVGESTMFHVCEETQEDISYLGNISYDTFYKQYSYSDSFVDSNSDVQLEYNCEIIQYASEILELTITYKGKSHRLSLDTFHSNIRISIKEWEEDVFFTSESGQTLEKQYFDMEGFYQIDTWNAMQENREASNKNQHSSYTPDVNPTADTLAGSNLSMICINKSKHDADKNIQIFANENEVTRPEKIDRALL